MVEHGAPDDPQLYARSFHDVYDAWYGELDDPAHIVEALAQRCAPPARVVEMGSGTGRIAIPLAQAGFRVIALDASATMLAATPAVSAAAGSAGAVGLQPVAGDMSQLPLAADSADACIVAYNTLFNLPSAAQQQQWFRDAARVLRPGGVVAVEAFVAAEASDRFGVSLVKHPTNDNAQLAIITGPDPSDPDNPDLIVGSHIELGAEEIVCRPWRLAYQSPDQLDAAACRAGLVPTSRFASWQGTSFDPAGARHVSWYAKPASAN